jgi:hypothetical protein
MKIKSFGCSFTFGTDLPDVDGTVDLPTPSQLTWPALSAKQLDLPYECFAFPGCGNLQILEQVLNQSAIDDPSFFIVNWTWIDRFDYVGPDGDQWHTVRPTNKDSVSKNFYKNLHSQYQDTLTSLIYIQTAVETLNRKKIPFLMTCIDDLLLDHQSVSSFALRHLQLYLQQFLTSFEGMNFLSWSRKHNFAESKLWHPLEPAHQAAAEYMVKIVDKQKTSDPARPVRV